MENAGAPRRAPRRGVIAFTRVVCSFGLSISVSIGLLLARPAIANADTPTAPTAPPPAATTPSKAPSRVPSPSNEPVSDATARMQVTDRPWAVGVSAERQQAALKYLQEGNSLLKESLFVEAAKVYRQALGEWDHPGIHYNLALALLNMDQPVEVFQNLQAAIKYGADPLDPEKLEHAKSYLRLIEKQVAAVDIRCDVDGAQVTFDGAPLFRSPGHYQGLVRAGTHTVTASKVGFNTTSVTEELTSEKRTEMNLKLYTAGDLIGYRRRYPIWRPIAIAAFGGVLLATGAIMSVQASKNINAFDNSATAICPASGCVPGSADYAALDQIHKRANTYQTLATISYIAGGTIAAAGVLLLIMDRSIPYRVDPESEHRDVARRSSSFSLSFSPSFSPLGGGLAGFAATGRF
jgi:tetratricopeptide (TPR) repeat protein